MVHLIFLLVSIGLSCIMTVNVSYHLASVTSSALKVLPALLRICRYPENLSGLFIVRGVFPHSVPSF